MPDAIALVDAKSTRITELDGVVDGYPEESFGFGTDTGSNPLETGASVTDHAVARPETVRLRAQVRGLRRSREAYAELKRLHESVTPVTLISPVAVIDELLVKGIDADRIGDGLRIRIELERIIRVGLQARAVAAPVSGPAMARTSALERGRITPDAATPSVEDALATLDEIDPDTLGDDVVDAMGLKEELDALLEEEGGLEGGVAGVLGALGDPTRLIRATASMATGFQRGGARGLTRALAQNVELPPDVEGALVGSSVVLDSYRSGRVRDAGSLLNAVAAGASVAQSGTISGRFGLCCSTPGAKQGDRLGETVADVLDAAGAFGLRDEVRMARASMVIGRRFAGTEPGEG